MPIWTRMGRAYYALGLEITSTTDGFLQLFFDGGGGFSEDRSSRLSLATGDRSYSLPLPPGRYLGLRLDPADRPGEFTIGDVRIRDYLGRVVATFSAADLMPVQHIDEHRIQEGRLYIRVAAGHDDPTVLLPVRQPLDLSLPWHAWLLLAVAPVAASTTLLLGSDALLRHLAQRTGGRLAYWLGGARLPPILTGVAVAIGLSILSTTPAVRPLSTGALMVLVVAAGITFVVACGTHRQSLRGTMVGLFLLVTAIVYLGANPLRGEITAPMDLLAAYPGWQESGLTLPLVDTVHHDVLDVFIPALLWAKRELLVGHLPFWNPLAGGGSQGWGIPIFSHVAPRFLLLLLFPDAVGYHLGVLFQVFWAALGTYLLCRLRLSVGPSLFGAVTYMACGMHSAWVPDIALTTSCFIPWVLWAACRLDEEITPGRIAVLAVLTALLLLAGFPSVAAFGIYLTAFMGISLVVGRWRSPRRGSARLLAALMSGGLLGVGLAMFQYIPLMHWLRWFNTDGRIGGSSIARSAANVLLDPFALGRPHFETSGYLGITAVVLSLIGLGLVCRRCSRWGPLSPWPWGAAAAFFLCATYGWPEPVSALIHKLPVFDFNPASRSLALVGLCCGVLAAVGLEELGRDATNQGQLRQLVVVWGLVPLLILIHLGDLTQVERAFNAVVPAKSFMPITPSIAFVRERIGPGQSILATGDGYLVSGTLTNYGLSEWPAHGFQTTPAKRIIEQAIDQAYVTTTAAAFRLPQVHLDSPWLQWMSVRFILSPARLDVPYKGWILHQQTSKIMILEHDAPPGGFLYAGPIDPVIPDQISWEGVANHTRHPDAPRFEVTTTSECRFVMSGKFLPGWTATVDGQPTSIEVLEGVFPSVRLSPGHHTMSWRYVPPGWGLGVGISIIALLVVAGLILGGLVARRQGSTLSR